MYYMCETCVLQVLYTYIIMYELHVQYTKDTCNIHMWHISEYWFAKGYAE